LGRCGGRRGNAAFSAALAAQEKGAKVLTLERAPAEVMGGNSRFTAGAFRCVYDGRRRPQGDHARHDAGAPRTGKA
jgi:succinate dehydrogenase/fumarate reductase flavoprotein subunit